MIYLPLPEERLHVVRLTIQHTSQADQRGFEELQLELGRGHVVEGLQALLQDVFNLSRQTILIHNQLKFLIIILK